MEPSQTQISTLANRLAIPISIVLAGVIIGGALIVALRQPSNSAAGALRPQGAEQSAGDLEAMSPITSADHIRGNKNAPVKIVEYSDTECPFCKKFHETMKQVMDEYGESGKVAWIYRHFPLDALHAKADKEAEAMECAAEQGGPTSPLGTSNDIFWRYADRIFEVTPSNDGLNPADLPKIANFVGLDVKKFNSCLSSGKYAQHVEEDTQNAQATGGSGTPWSIVLAPNGKKYPLSGAQPYASVKQLIELALQEN
ncbi:MAG TPA: thioredoxin domain-containing protein [Candidatus Paceibacterota bacterium]